MKPTYSVFHNGSSVSSLSRNGGTEKSKNTGSQHLNGIGCLLHKALGQMLMRFAVFFHMTFSISSSLRSISLSIALYAAASAAIMQKGASEP